MIKELIGKRPAHPDPNRKDSMDIYISNAPYLELRGYGFMLVSEEEEEMETAYDLNWKLRKESFNKIAMLGGGICLYPRFCKDHLKNIDIYEIEPEIAEWNQKKWGDLGHRWIIGDWRKTLPKENIIYDLVLFDTDKDLDHDLLKKYAKKIWYYPNWTEEPYVTRGE